MLRNVALPFAVLVGVAMVFPLATKSARVAAAATTAPTSFGFYLPAGKSVTFQKDATISVAYNLADAKGRATCHRMSITYAKQPPFELWFDQAAALANNFLVLKGQTIQAIPCLGNSALVPATLYISGSVTTTVPTKAIVSPTPY
jgi:hypothetical protein